MNTICARSRASFALLLAFGAVLVAHTARADVDIPNEFGNDDTSFAIGYGGGTNKVVMRRHKDGACRTVAVGNGTGLLADTWVRGGFGNDIMWVIDGSPSVVLCGVTLGSVRYNGHKLNIDASQGSDILVGDKTALLIGASGGDIFFVRGVAKAVGTGTNWFFAQGGQAILNGGDGSDLFCNFSGEPTFAAAHGGNGYDYLWGGAHWYDNIEKVLPTSDTTCNSYYNVSVVYIAENW